LGVDGCFLFMAAPDLAHQSRPVALQLALKLILESLLELLILRRRQLHCSSEHIASLLLLALLADGLLQPAVRRLSFPLHLHQSRYPLLGIEQVGSLDGLFRSQPGWRTIAFIQEHGNLHFGAEGVEHFGVL
jgi:hypothetical protein